MKKYALDHVYMKVMSVVYSNCTYTSNRSTDISVLYAKHTSPTHNISRWVISIYKCWSSPYASCMCLVCFRNLIYSVSTCLLTWEWCRYSITFHMENCLTYIANIMANDYLPCRQQFCHYHRSQHIKADIKWPTFPRRHFQMHFLERKCIHFA